MLSIRKLACVALLVMVGGFAAPAMAARTYTISYAYFNSSGQFVGQNLWSCDNRNISGGTVTQYSVVQSYPCYPDPNVDPPSVSSTLPPGLTQDQACHILATSPYGADICGDPPVFAYGP